MGEIEWEGFHLSLFIFLYCLHFLMMLIYFTEYFCGQWHYGLFCSILYMSLLFKRKKYRSLSIIFKAI